MTDEWGPWQAHDGKGCPCVGQVVQAVHLRAKYYLLPSGAHIVDTIEDPPEVFVAGCHGGESWDWSNWPKISRVIRYRIRRPRALIQLIDMVENLPVQEREDA